MHVGCFGPSLNNRLKMHLAEPAAVYKSGSLKPPYDGVTADSVICLFFEFF